MSSENSSSLRSTLRGVTDARFSSVTHYRGIKYASIPERFARPVLNTEWPGTETDCTRFGPRCPQPPRDIRDLMRIPHDLPANEPEEEDEFLCTNLNVTCPTESGPEKCPVLVWLYGGAQVTSYGTAAQKIGDPGPLVAQSIEQGKPIILVTPHYRLNVFAFGTPHSEVNLALKDQRAALDWVRTFIENFGGDPDNITLGGESAGAIYTHALLASGSNTIVARAILDSGCLYTIPPQPQLRCRGLIDLIEGNLQIMELEEGNLTPAESVEATVEGAPADRIIQTMNEFEINSMWMWQEKDLVDWDDDARVFGALKGLLISDCEYESAIYEKLAMASSASGIMQAFETSSPELGMTLATAYGVDSTNDVISRRAMLMFLNDVRFAYPAHALARQINNTGGTAYQYYFDQVNPFVIPSVARAHHAVDLFAVFGGYDDLIKDDMPQVGRALREKWIDFINGIEPWDKNNIYEFGPNGEVGEMTPEIAAPRRRQDQFSVLEEAGHEVTNKICLRLIAAASTSIPHRK